MSEQPGPGPSFGMRHQLGVYLAGLEGRKPSQPTGMENLRDMARAKLSQEAFDYLDGGAGSEDTMRANLDAFTSWRIVPRMLRGVAQPERSVELFGQNLSAPLLLAPIGVQSILHPDAEVAVARAAAALDVPFVLSTASSKRLEDVAAAGESVPRWFQLYWSRNRDFTASLVRRAEQAGFGAIVVTLDTLQLAWRERDIDNAYLPFLGGEGLANYFSDPVFRAALPSSPEENPRLAIEYFASVFSEATLTWSDLRFLRDHTALPILVKGILHPDDARRAADQGMDGVIVSNHGGRQVDGAIAALDALPMVVEAAGDRMPVLFDSGIRRAADLVKAIALGARAGLLGRPYAYGLAVHGEDGVRLVLHNFLADLDLTMALIGCATVADIDIDCLEVE